MQRITLAVVAALLTVAAVPAMASANHKRGKGATVYQVALKPLNDSGVTGKATLIRQRGDRLRVIIRAKGLEPHKLHPQHIHGLSGDTNATCPPPSAADNREGLPQESDMPDEFISLEEGAPFYGPVLQSLTPFPTANRAGVVTYSRSFEVSGDLLDLSDEVVVLHGMTLSGGYAATLPVACGEID